MASLRITPQELRIDLTTKERIGALHGSFGVHWRDVVSVEPTSNLWSEVRGIRAPGTGLPGSILLGTMRHNGLKDFCAIYRQRPGVVIALSGAGFARLLISSPSDQVAAVVAAHGRVSAGISADAGG
jgi:hypothetical protein